MKFCISLRSSLHPTRRNANEYAVFPCLRRHNGRPDVRLDGRVCRRDRRQNQLSQQARAGGKARSNHRRNRYGLNARPHQLPHAPSDAAAARIRGRLEIAGMAQRLHFPARGPAGRQMRARGDDAGRGRMFEIWRNERVRHVLFLRRYLRRHRQVRHEGKYLARDIDVFGRRF